MSSGICTPLSDDVSVTVFSSPTLADAGPDQNLCNVGSTTLAGNTIVIGSGLWSQVSGPVVTFSDATLANSTVNGMIPGTYVFQWTSTNGSCTSSDQVTISNSELPTVSNAAPAIDNCLFSSLNLMGNTPVVGTGTWSQIAGSPVIISSPSSPTSAVLGTVAGSYTCLLYTSRCV